MRGKDLLVGIAIGATAFAVSYGVLVPPHGTVKHSATGHPVRSLFPFDRLPLGKPAESPARSRETADRLDAIHGEREFETMLRKHGKLLVLFTSPTADLSGEARRAFRRLAADHPALKAVTVNTDADLDLATEYDVRDTPSFGYFASSRDGEDGEVAFVTSSRPEYVRWLKEAGAI